MDKWIKNGFEYRYEFSRDSGEKFVIRINDVCYELMSQYRDGRGYWQEHCLARFPTLRKAKEYAALICPETGKAVTA